MASNHEHHSTNPSVSVTRGIFDDDSDERYYVSLKEPRRILSREEIEGLSHREKRRLQRVDPDRPWLVDGAQDKSGGDEELYALRQLVYVRDNFTCQSCGEQFIPQAVLDDEDFSYDGRHNVRGLTLGHVIQKCQDGERTPENIKAQCSPCNHDLGDEVWTEFIN